MAGFIKKISESQNEMGVIDWGRCLFVGIMVIWMAIGSLWRSCMVVKGFHEM